MEKSTYLFSGGSINTLWEWSSAFLGKGFIIFQVFWDVAGFEESRERGIEVEFSPEHLEATNSKYR